MAWIGPVFVLVLISISANCNNSVKELMRASLMSSLPYTSDQEKIREFHDYANKLDYDDCAKKLLCILASKQVSELEWDEEVLVNTYTVDPARMDFSLPTVQFNVAIQVGRGGRKNCNNVYSNCLLSPEDLQKSMRNQGLSIDIQGKSSDCSVYFLWRNNQGPSDQTEPNTVE